MDANLPDSGFFRMKRRSEGMGEVFFLFLPNVLINIYETAKLILFFSYFIFLYFQILYRYLSNNVYS